MTSTIPGHVLAAALLSALVLLRSHVAFHGLVELFSIRVGIAIFLIPVIHRFTRNAQQVSQKRTGAVPDRAGSRPCTQLEPVSPPGCLLHPCAFVRPYAALAVASGDVGPFARGFQRKALAGAS